MNTSIYMKNLKDIHILREDNKKICAEIKEKLTKNCSFKVGDIIKGQAHGYSSRKVGVIKVQDFDISFNNVKNEFFLFARGLKMNFDGSHKMRSNCVGAILINETTKLI